MKIKVKGVIVSVNNKRHDVSKQTFPYKEKVVYITIKPFVVANKGI